MPSLSFPQDSPCTWFYFQMLFPFCCPHFSSSKSKQTFFFFTIQGPLNSFSDFSSFQYPLKHPEYLNTACTPGGTTDRCRSHLCWPRRSHCFLNFSECRFPCKSWTTLSSFFFHCLWHYSFVCSQHSINGIIWARNTIFLKSGWICRAVSAQGIYVQEATFTAFSLPTLAASTPRVFFCLVSPPSEEVQCKINPCPSSCLSFSLPRVTPRKPVFTARGGGGRGFLVLRALL